MAHHCRLAFESTAWLAQYDLVEASLNRLFKSANHCSVGGARGFSATPKRLRKQFPTIYNVQKATSYPANKSFAVLPRNTSGLLEQSPHFQLSNSFVRFVGSQKISPRKNSSFVAEMKDWEENLDPVQRKLLEEECIVLDDQDKVIGHDSKKNCHLIRNGDVQLHRAFSVFLFNSKGELLMQQRSNTKITFPMMWTNTCCSHPLFTPEELLEDNAHGVKVAAKRRLEIELGISSDAISTKDFQYLTRIHYKALSNGIWGEHEIDYILVLQKDLDVTPNPEEVAEVRYLSPEDMDKMAANDTVRLTPWFSLIYKSWLPLWWKNLHNLKPFKDHGRIHKM